jgi:methionyl-tRNA formyltransferase
MRLVFFGTGTFCLPALRDLAENISLVVTQPDRPSGRGMKLQPAPAKTVALELGLEVATPEKCRDPEFVERIESIDADALLVASYGQILTQRLLDSAARGGINLHGSILPRWRGAAPIQRSIQHGDLETGVTLMQMDKGMDTGDIIAIEKTLIGPDETYGKLQDRLALIAAQMARAWLPRIVLGDYPRSPQDDAKSTIAPKVEASERELEFSATAEVAYAKFRAFAPAPGSFLATRFGKLKVVDARLGTKGGPPGVVISTTEGCEVALAGGSLILREVQLEGKKKMSGRDFANGMRLQAGTSLL